MKYLLIIFLFLASPVLALEKDYQIPWCEERGGVAEYRLPDKTRVDCLTEDYAIEVDFAKKWAEAIGQSLYYSIETNKRAGVVLIIEPEDLRFINRINAVATRHSIRVWLVEK